MGRRRNHHGNSWDTAHFNVRELERKVIEATVPIRFTVDDVLRWLFPEDVIDTMKRAYAMANTGRYVNNMNITEAGLWTLHIDLHEAGMLVPAYPLPDLTTRENYKPIGETFDAMRAVEREFDRIRLLIDKVKTWTPTATKYYFPAVCAVLPPNSPVHNAEGTPREPDGLAQLLPHLRDAAGTLASALLCPEVEKKDKPILRVGFWRSQDIGVSYFHSVL